jgi:hypothetical protein
MKNLEVVINTIKKEQALQRVVKTLKITLKDDSPLDVSYLLECFAILGIPSEKSFKKYDLNLDPFINDYVAMVYEEKPIEKTLKSWEKKLEGKTLDYAYSKNKSLVKDFFLKEQKLNDALNFLKVREDSPLARLNYDWELAYALCEKKAEDSSFNEMLFQVVEKGHKVSELIQII